MKHGNDIDVSADCRPARCSSPAAVSLVDDASVTGHNPLGNAESDIGLVRSVREQRVNASAATGSPPMLPCRAHRGGEESNDVSPGGDDPSFAVAAYLDQMRPPPVVPVQPPPSIGDLLRYLAHVERTEAVERQIRARQREIVHIAHEDGWKFCSPTARYNAVVWSRIRHTESVRRSIADRRAAAAMVGIV